MLRRVLPAGAWSVAALASLVNAGCFATRVPPPPVPEQEGSLPLELAWEDKMGSGFSGSMVVTDSVIYAGALDRRVYAIETATGRKLWNKRLPGALVGGVAHAGDTLFIGSDRPGGSIRAVSSADGKEIWQERTDRISVPLLVTDGKVIAHTNPGVLLALRTWDGAFEWQQHLGVALAAPVHGEDGNMVATTLDTIYRISLDDGRVVQRMSAPGSVTSNWAESGTYLIAGTTSGIVFKMDRRDLNIEWQVRVESEVLVSPVVSGDTVFVVTRPGNVYRIDPDPAPEATLIAELEWPVTAPLSRFDRWLLLGGADGVIRALEIDGTEAWRLALWRPIAVAPIIMPDGFLAFGGIGDIHRLVSQ